MPQIDRSTVAGYVVACLQAETDWGIDLRSPTEGANNNQWRLLNDETQTTYSNSDDDYDYDYDYDYD